MMDMMAQNRARKASRQRPAPTPALRAEVEGILRMAMHRQGADYWGFVRPDPVAQAVDRILDLIERGGQ